MRLNGRQNGRRGCRWYTIHSWMPCVISHMTPQVRNRRLHALPLPIIWRQILAGAPGSEGSYGSFINDDFVTNFLLIPQGKNFENRRAVDRVLGKVCFSDSASTYDGFICWRRFIWIYDMVHKLERRPTSYRDQYNGFLSTRNFYGSLLDKMLTTMHHTYRLMRVESGPQVFVYIIAANWVEGGSICQSLRRQVRVSVHGGKNGKHGCREHLLGVNCLQGLKSTARTPFLDVTQQISHISKVIFWLPDAAL